MACGTSPWSPRAFRKRSRLLHPHNPEGMKKSGAPALAIQLLGGFHVRVWGKLVADAQWPRRQAKQLVKLLALNPKHQLHRQQLIDAIYPDLNAESGAANLHKIIHLARHALEPSLKAGAKSQLHPDARAAGAAACARRVVD